MINSWQQPMKNNKIQTMIADKSVVPAGEMQLRAMFDKELETAYGSICTRKYSYQCGLCQAQFTAMQYLLEHMETHTCVRKYICRICDEPFKRENKLKRHMLYHDETNLHTCSVCNKRFIQDIQLQRHMLIHDNLCTVCNKKFTHYCILKKHMLTHTQSGDKMHECHLCKKRYARIDYFKQHQKLSNFRDKNRKIKDPSLLCAICGKSYSQIGSFKRHMLSMQTNHS